MKRIGWQRKDRAEHLEALLNQRLEQWCNDWLVGGSAGVGLAQSAPDSKSPSGCRLLVSGEIMAWLQFEDDLELMLGRDALRLKASQPEGFVREVGKRGFDELHAQLFGDCEAVASNCADALVEADHDPRFGALSFDVRGLPGSVRMTVNRAWCDRQAPMAEQARDVVRLTNRREALGSTPVILSASLALGEIPLSESLSWRVGEVLVTEAVTNSLVKLTSGESQIVRGRLTTQQGARSVELA